MRILVLTAMYPTDAQPARGTFVKQQVQSLREKGLEIEVLDFEGGRSLWNYLRAGWQLRRRVARGDVDLVHAHYGLTGLPAAMQRRVPFVLTYHGSDLLGELGRRGRYTTTGRWKVLLGQVMGRFAARRIVVAEVLRDRLWGGNAAVIPMGVDLELFRPLAREEARTALGLPAGRPLVVFVSSPANPVKRFELARAAVDRARREAPDIELLPVTDVAQDEVPLYMNAADALILTSSHEASPCVVKEAMACNLPVVAVDVGDVRERIEGIAGCHVCESSPDALAAGLVDVLRTGERSQGRQRVIDISLPEIARQVMSVYDDVIHGGRVITRRSHEGPC